jgi:hypothetical protein
MTALQEQLERGQGATYGLSLASPGWAIAHLGSWLSSTIAGNFALLFQRSAFARIPELGYALDSRNHNMW